MKMRFLLFVAAALFLFQGASPWEGAGAIAPEGELPAAGRYVATNSYPRNTIVDVTNIETGKSIRVIVSNTLNSSGLLALVSREAAELIGMRAGSVSRIRMVQPSDPMAYSRFTESFSSDAVSSAPNVINNENPAAQTSGRDSFTPHALVRQPPEAPPTLESGQSYLLEPEWSGRGQSFVDLNDYNARLNAPPAQSAALAAEPDPTPVTEQRPLSAQSPVAAEPDFDKPVFIEIQDEIVKSGQIREEIVEPSGQTREDVPEVAKIEYEIDEPPENTETPPIEITDGGSVEYFLVPTNENPPEGIYGIDPSDIIPGITAAPPERAVVVTPAPDSSYTAFTRYQEPELERNMYYVQLASVTSPESAENAISRIVRQTDGAFDDYTIVYRESDNRYRILLGPLNQGESAAVLARFKSIGYGDAFVRRGR